MRSFTCLLVFTLFLFSCSKKKQASNLDSDVTIELREALDSVDLNDGKLELYCKTTQIYGCVNYSITYLLNKQQNTISLQFTNIFMPDLCLTAIGPATSSVDLGKLESGEYAINIVSPMGMAQGTLTVKDDQYKLNLPANTKGFQLQGEQLYKIPAQTIWGGIGYPKAEDSTIVTQFLNDLKALGATEQYFQPGNYQRFLVDANGDVVIDGGGYWYHKPLLLHYGGPAEPLKALLRSYGQAYPDLYIGIYNDKGQFFYSW